MFTLAGKDQPNWRKTRIGALPVAIRLQLAFESEYGTEQSLED
jgi:hypothetical protein